MHSAMWHFGKFDCMHIMISVVGHFRVSEVSALPKMALVEYLRLLRDHLFLGFFVMSCEEQDSESWTSHKFSHKTIFCPSVFI